MFELRIMDHDNMPLFSAANYTSPFLVWNSAAVFAACILAGSSCQKSLIVKSCSVNINICQKKRSILSEGIHRTGKRHGYPEAALAFTESALEKQKNIKEKNINMRTSGSSYKICLAAVALSLFSLTGCAGKNDQFTDQPSTEMRTLQEDLQADEQRTEAMRQEERSTEAMRPEADEAGKAIADRTEPDSREADWTGYFHGINGAAVIFDSTENCYWICNPKLADTRRSPCSTFKIISSLAALERGVIKADESVRSWSGEVFWNEQWNRDLDFTDAFRASCVWYFREVTDEIGRDVMQEELNRLGYGNCDISDWSGSLNTNNNNPALTGFWIESSLLISPKEQVNVMEAIFGGQTAYSEETLRQLKQVMLLPEQEEEGVLIYGKTGMGKAYGVTVDAWYTGFAENGDRRISFCVYLGETNDKEVTSATARDIAVNIISDYLN